MDSFSNTKLGKSGSIRNRPSIRQKYRQAILEKSKGKEKEKAPVLNIYAELSRKHYQQIMNDEIEVRLPPGVSMKNRAGSRGLFFECVDEETTKVLIDGLEASGIHWQED